MTTVVALPTASELLQEELAQPGFVLLDGRRYKLAFPMRAVLLYKKLTGDNLFVEGALEQVNPQKDPERWLSCLEAALQQHHPEVTREQLELWVDFGNVSAVSAAMFETLKSYLPQPKDKGKSPNAPAPAADLPASESQSPSSIV